MNFLSFKQAPTSNDKHDIYGSSWEHISRMEHTLFNLRIHIQHIMILIKDMCSSL